MPLSPPAPREPIHSRQIDCRGYRRADGLWDLEGRLTDSKSYPFDNRWRGRLEPGQPVHDMRVRLTVDDRLVVRAVEAATDASPFAICPKVAPNFQRLEGLHIGPGWSGSLRQALGGVEGCTHLLELFGRLGTVAYQTIMPLRAREPEPEATAHRPRLIDSCYAWRADGPVVKEFYPGHYTGPSEAEDG